MHQKNLFSILLITFTIILAGCGSVKIPDVSGADIQARLLEGKTYIAEDGLVQGDIINGAQIYQEHCEECHGEDGKKEDLGDDTTSIWLGTSANKNALDFFRVTNFGDATRKMPGFYEDATLIELINVIAYAQTLEE